MDFIEHIKILKKELRNYEDSLKLEHLINIGYYLAKSENMVPKKIRVEKKKFTSWIVNNEFLKINDYLNNIINYYLDVKSKYYF